MHSEGQSFEAYLRMILARSSAIEDIFARLGCVKVLMRSYG